MKSLTNFEKTYFQDQAKKRQAKLDEKHRIKRILSILYITAAVLGWVLMILFILWLHFVYLKPIS